MKSDVAALCNFIYFPFSFGPSNFDGVVFACKT